MKKEKTFEQMLKAYKEVRRQVIDAKLDDITSVAITNFNNPVQHRDWITIEVNIGVGGEFVANQCRYIRIVNYDFGKGMEAYKAALAERINQHTNP